MLKFIRHPLARFIVYTAVVVTFVSLRLNGYWIFGLVTIILVVYAEDVSNWLFGKEENRDDVERQASSDSFSE